MAQLTEKERQNVELNALGALISILSCIVGLIMVLFGSAFAPQCKMKVIDTTSWNKDHLRGNLPSWFVYTGTFLLLFGFLSCCTVGVFPLWLRGKSRIAGGALADILTGMCGKMVLFAMYCILTICNLLGVFWLYLASLGRNESNSTYEGDVNYCTPRLWVFAHIFTKTYWVLSILGAISICSRIYRFIKKANE